MSADKTDKSNNDTAHPNKILIDWNVLDALMQFKVTLSFVADYMKVSEDTIARRIREEYDLTFSEYNKLRMQRTAVKLQQKAIEMALGGNATMMIFALKNVANWQDKVEQNVNNSGPIDIKLVKDDAS